MQREPRVSWSFAARRPTALAGRCATATPPRPARYILTMDCDFVLLVPELRDLFDAVADGADGAIGSRFSYESVLINYPFFKILCNRAFTCWSSYALRRRARHLQQPEAVSRGHPEERSTSKSRTSPRTWRRASSRCSPAIDIERSADIVDQPDGRHGSSSFRIAGWRPDIRAGWRAFWRSLARAAQCSTRPPPAPSVGIGADR